MHKLFRALAALMLLSMATTAAAQFPDKPVRIIVPYGAGGPTDLLARVLGQGLTEIWGRQVLVENRPGANGHIGTEAVVKAAPDGYTLLVVPAGPIVINHLLFKKMPFDAVGDLTPISQLADGPMVMYVATQLPVATLQDFVKYAKQNPGRLNFASTGSGTLPHLMGEMLKAQAGIDMVHVPYKGVPQAISAVMTNEVSLMFDSGNSLPYAKAGKIRALAVFSRNRYSAAPELPTANEAGFPDMETTAWYGLLGPANMPAELVRKIHGDTAKALLNPEAKERLASVHLEAIASTPEAFAKTIPAERARWAKVVSGAGIVPE